MDKRINEYIHKATYNERDEAYYLDNEELIKCSIALSLASIAENLEKLTGCMSEGNIHVVKGLER